MNKLELKYELLDVIMKNCNNMYQALEDVEYFDKVYNKYNNDLEYISRMKETCASYFLKPNLCKEDRKVFVDGMIFVSDKIIILEESSANNALNIDEKISFINYSLENTINSKQICLTPNEEIRFREGAQLSINLYLAIDSKAK